MKLPGLGEFMPRNLDAGLTCAPFDFDSARAAIGEALAAFDSRRLLWGSDFPVVGSREGYANALQWTRECVGAVAPAALEAAFGGNARRFYPALAA